MPETDFSYEANEYDVTELKGDYAGDTEFGSDGVSLTGNTKIVGGNLTVSVDNYLSLNGYTLEVTGNLYHKSGWIELTNGTLIVGGDYIHGSKEENATGGLKMDDTGDHVVVKGNFVDYSADHITHTRGTLEVGGNYTQNKIGISYNNGPTAGHTVVLTGEGDQEVDVSDAVRVQSAAIFDGLEIKNPDRTITWKGALEVDNIMSDIHVKTADEKALEVRYLRHLEGHTLTVDNDVIQSGEIKLDQGKMEVAGTFYHRDGTFYVDGGTLNIKGDYKHETADGGEAGGTLDMYSGAGSDQVNISGNYLYNGTRSPHLSTGRLAVAKNFSQNCMTDCASKHTFVFNGDGDQTIEFLNSGKGIYNLEIENPDARKITWKGFMNVTALQNDIALKTDGDLEISYLDLGQKNLKIDGNVIQSGNVVINKGTLDVTGNYYHRDGKLDFKVGKVNIGGDYIHQTEDKEPAPGNIYMYNDAEQLNISGAYVYNGSESPWYGRGTVRVKGDFTQNIKTGTALSEFKTILDGDDAQTVNIPTGDNVFVKLEVKNGTTRDITWNGTMNIMNLLSDVNVKAGSGSLELSGLNMDGKTLKIDGDVTQTGDVKLGKGTLDISGTFTQTDGQISLGGGTLNIGKDYIHQGEVGKLADGTLSMTDENDRVNIANDYIESGRKGAVKLYNGVLSIGGNFEQFSEDVNPFDAREAHVTILKGEEKQSISFECAEGKFGTLKLTKPLDNDNYTFTPANCWMKLIAADGEEIGGEEEEPDEPEEPDESSYKVTFDTNDGPNVERQEIAAGGKVKKPEDPAKTGYTFAGWYKDAEYAAAWDFDADVVTGETTIYAKWTANTYTIKFDGNSSTGGSMETMTVSYDQETALTDNKYTRINSDFTGWNTEPDGTGTAYADKAAVKNLRTENGATITLYARWQFKPGQYKITYNLNGGTKSELNPEHYDGDWESFTLATPTKEGYTFGGWYTKKNCKAKSKVTEIAKGSSGDVTLYAKWTANKYTVAFESNGGTKGKMTAMKNKVYGKKFKLKANKFKRTGYVFTGWNTKADGTGTAYRNKESVTNLTAASGATVTLYAQWRRSRKT